MISMKLSGEENLPQKKIDKCTDKQEPHVIAKGFNYRLISCVLNTKTKKEFTPFIEEVQKELKNDNCIEIFSMLTEKLKELANLDDTETLKKYRNAFFSIYVNAMDEKNDRKEYIKKMMFDIYETNNLGEFINTNELTESPGAFDANFEYNNKLHQGKVLISKNTDEAADSLEEEELEKEEQEIIQQKNKEKIIFQKGIRFSDEEKAISKLYKRIERRNRRVKAA